MPWYASTFEHFAVTPVRPAPPERVDVREKRRPRPHPPRDKSESTSRGR